MKRENSEFALLTLCDRIYLMSPRSTFGWWAAYLSSRNATVYYNVGQKPSSKWEQSGYFLPDWIAVDNRETWRTPSLPLTLHKIVYTESNWGYASHFTIRFRVWRVLANNDETSALFGLLFDYFGLLSNCRNPSLFGFHILLFKRDNLLAVTLLTSTPLTWTSVTEPPLRGTKPNVHNNW